MLWHNRRLGVGVMAIVGALSGVLMAFGMPRGAVTATQALALMGTGAVVGLIAGVVMHSRWALVLAPVAHVVGFELGRVGAHAPTVDAIPGRATASSWTVGRRRLAAPAGATTSTAT